MATNETAGPESGLGNDRKPRLTAYVATGDPLPAYDGGASASPASPSASVATATSEFRPVYELGPQAKDCGIPENVRANLVSPMGVALIRIEPGTFTMGLWPESASYAPLHEVTLTKPFFSRSPWGC